MPDAPERTRRQFLRAGLATSLLGLAGCGEGDATTSTQPASDGPFARVAVDGEFLVVELAPEQDVSTVNLIAPDGTLFGQRQPAAGVRTLRFRLIELDSLQPKHYTPGEYELVAVSGEKTASQSVKLRSDLRVREIAQHSDSKSRLIVVLENVGSAPTWVFDITYKNSAYWGANDGLISNPAIPHLLKPESSDNRILRPGEKRTFVGLNNPLRFLDTDANLASCDRSFEMSVIVGIARVEPIRKQILVTPGGSVEHWGMGDGYTCDDVSIEILERDNGQDIGGS